MHMVEMKKEGNIAMEETILQIINDYYEDMEPGQIKLSSRFYEDLDISSMEFFSLVTEIEQEFGIRVSDRDLQKISTVGDVVRMVAEKTGK